MNKIIKYIFIISLALGSISIQASWLDSIKGLFCKHKVTLAVTSLTSAAAASLWYLPSEYIRTKLILGVGTFLGALRLAYSAERKVKQICNIDEVEIIRTKFIYANNLVAKNPDATYNVHRAIYNWRNDMLLAFNIKNTPKIKNIIYTELLASIPTQESLALLRNRILQEQDELSNDIQFLKSCVDSGVLPKEKDLNVLQKLDINQYTKSEDEFENRIIEAYVIVVTRYLRNRAILEAI